MGTGVGEMMLMSAAMGGGTAAITGGDPLKGALLGGLTGGLGAGISNAMSAAQPLANAGVSAGANAGQAAINSQLTNTLPNAAVNASSAAAGNAGVMTPFTSVPNITSAANAGANAASNASTAVANAGIAPNPIANFSNPSGVAGPYTKLLPSGAPTPTFDPSAPYTNPTGIAGRFGYTPTPPTAAQRMADLNAASDLKYTRVAPTNLQSKQNLVPMEAKPTVSTVNDIRYQMQPYEANFTGTNARLAGAEQLNPGLNMSKMAYQPNLGGAKAIDTGGISDLAGGDKFSLKEFLKTSGKGPSLYDDPYEYIKEHKMPAISAALAGSTARKSLPEEEEYDGPLSRFRFNPATYQPNYFAEGGIAMLAAGGYDRQVGEDPYPMRMASGGISDLGGYSDGGRMLQGPGDGMSDSIPASISGKRPARLADGEFVVPADVVSHLGNGSTDAGAKQLYSMMDKVRTARTGKKKQARAVTPQKYMPA